jgi:hypothetical protein
MRSCHRVDSHAAVAGGRNRTSVVGRVLPAMPARRQMHVSTTRTSPVPQIANLETGDLVADRPSLPICPEFCFGMNSGATPAPVCGDDGACRSRDSMAASKRPGAVALVIEQAPAPALRALPGWTRTTRLAACGGRLHRPDDPQAGPRGAHVTSRAPASVRRRTAASRGETSARRTGTRPCLGTIASTTAASLCQLCLCHASSRPAGRRGLLVRPG